MSIRSYVEAQFRRLSGGKDLIHELVAVEPSYTFDEVTEWVTSEERAEERRSTFERVYDAMEHVKAMHPHLFQEEVQEEALAVTIDWTAEQLGLDCNKVGKQMAREKIIMANARIDRRFYGRDRGHRKGVKREDKDFRRNWFVN